MERDRALALLDETHQFPGHYDLRVIVRPDAHEAILGVVHAALVARAGHVVASDTRPSSGGKYLALRVRIHVETAAGVLDLYSELGQTDGVVMTL